MPTAQHPQAACHRSHCRLCDGSAMFVTCRLILCVAVGCAVTFAPWPWGTLKPAGNGGGSAAASCKHVGLSMRRGRRATVSVPQSSCLEKGVLHAAHGCITICGRHAQMEDRAACVPALACMGKDTCDFFGIFDGHEGAATAEFAAQHLPRTIAQQLGKLSRCSSWSISSLFVTECARKLHSARHPVSADVRVSDALPEFFRANHSESAIQAAVQRGAADVDKAFLRTAAAEHLQDGSTAVWALLCGGRYLIGSIGDSYAILCGRQPPSGTTTPAGQGGGEQSPASKQQQAAEQVLLGQPEPDQMSPEDLRGPELLFADGSVDSQLSAAAEGAAQGQSQHQQHEHGKAQILSAIHSPAREDERRRIEGAGGFVRTTSGRPM